MMTILLMSTFLLMNISMLEMSFILSLMLMMLMISSLENFNMIIFNSNFNMDKISLTMISLSIFSLILILISSNEWNSLNIFLKWILTLLYMCFISSTLISFYMFFEAVLMPTMFLITLKGKSSERLQAGIYLMIYTISGSLPLLLGILMNKNIPSFLINSIFLTNFLFPLIFIMAFMVKLPTFFLHLWLPKAHVEAPLEGSMILASIILKLGGYGMIRFSKFLLKMPKSWNSLIISLSMISMLFTSMTCMRQKDLKALIAYSSIAHMALILSSLFTFFSLGEKGCIMMMIMHGMTSSALFFLITIMYKNFHSRNILNLKGLLLIFPSLTLWWFIFLMLNFSVPPSIGLISEILMFSSMIQINNNLFSLIIISSLSVFSFSVILFASTSHNSTTLWLSKMNSTNKEFLSMLTHLFPIIMLTSKPELLSFSLKSSKREIVGFKIIMIMSLMMLFTSLWLMLSSTKLLLSKTMISINFPILFLSSSPLSINIILDWMSTLFGSIVLLISSIILLYSYYYIPKKEFNRFSILLFLFVLSMLLMIFSNNIFFMMLGWDGLGITSYIMVIFYQDYNSNNAGTLTIFSNRLGDITILLSISSLLTMGNLNFSMNFNFPKISIILILVASLSKSAQIPLSAWLPAAMAAPTPISALVHSSTLVTAGVFIMMRIFKNLHPNSSFLLLLASVSTLMISSMCASWEQDLKKIIAFSTLSQISMMMFTISINAMKAAFFHLITHALFKSTMFLCAGMIIHKSNYQDSRFQSFNFINNNWMMSIMGISSMAMMGLPFLSGFFSKDMIIETALYSNLNSIFIIMMLMSLGMTTCYSTRLSFLLSKLMYKKKMDNFLMLSIPLFMSINILCPFSILMGFYLSWILPFQNTLIILPFMKILISLFIMLGMFISFSLIWNKKKMISLSEKFMTIWFLKYISIFSSSKMPKLGFKSMFFDNSWMEMFMINKSLKSMILSSKNIYYIFSTFSLTLMLLLITITMNK